MAQMAEAILGFKAAPKPHMHFHAPNSTRNEMSACPRTLRSWSRFGWNTNPSQLELINRRMAADKWRARASPDWPLMAVLVQHAEGQRDLILHKYVWHLNDDTIKAVYTAYIMFTCWGCCVFGSTKDPYYDSEEYRADGGDGTGHWVYEKQEDIEESARAELWREELIEEIEQKVGGLRELEEASKEEELVK